MKKIFSLVVTSAVLGFFSGCQKQEAPAPASPVVSAQKNSFKEVTAHLDAGGDFYLYLSTEQVLDNLSAKAANLRDAIAGGPALTDAQRGKVNKGFDVLTSLIKESGIEDISGFGASSVATEKNFYHSKMFLHHYPDRGSGFMWKMFGAQPHALDGLDLLSTNTVLAVFSDWDAPLARSTLQAQVERLNLPQVKGALDQWPAQFEKATGMKWDAVINSLGGEFGIALLLDESKQITLPMAPGLAMPEPGLLIVAKVKDDTLFNGLDQKLAKGPLPVTHTDQADLKMGTMTVPVPLPISLRPTFASGGGYLFIASTDSIIQDALAIKAGRQPGLKSTAEFKRLSQNVPQEGNQFTYVSQRFGGEILKIQQETLAMKSQGQSGQQQWLQNLMKPDRAGCSYCVSEHVSDGWLSVANGNQHPAKILAAAAVVPVGMISAIAIPNFVKARQTSQRNACINNLRRIDAAKNQWALEKSKASSDVPTWQDLQPYLARPGQLMPHCPQGGQYTIGAVGEPPTCSISDHQLPH